MNGVTDVEGWIGGLFTASAQAALLVPLILLVQWLFRNRLSARWRHALWWLVAARLLIPVSLSTPVSIFNFARLDYANSPAGAVAVGEPVRAASTTTESSAQRTDQTYGNSARERDERFQYAESAGHPSRLATHDLASDEAGAVTAPAVASAEPAPSQSIGWKRVAAGLWLAGVLAFSGLVLGQSICFSRRLRRSTQRVPTEGLELLRQARERMGVRRNVELVETDAVSSPVLYGLLKLQVLLPPGFAERFSRRELEHVLLHELAHVKRGDLWVNWLVTLLQVAHWFNPLVWLAFARMRSDREPACDELALEHAGEEAATEYGRTIIKLLEGFTRPAATPGLVGILEDKQQMKRRIIMIAKFKKPGRWSATAALLIAALGLVTLTDGQTNRPEGEPAVEAVEEFTPLDLTPYYETGELSDFNGPGGWETFPKGDQVFSGIPFSARGFIMLYGETLQRNKNVPLKKVIEQIPVNRTFEQVHLLHAAAWPADDGTVISLVRLNYADGSWAALPITYGEQVVDLWRSDFEPPVDFAPDTRLAWSVTPPSAEGTALSFRLSVTSLDNPKPDQTVTSITLQSTEEAASDLIVGLTVGRALSTDELEALPTLVERQEPRDSTMAFKVVRGASLSPVPGVRLKVGGTVESAGAKLGEVVTGSDGVALIRYSSRMSRLFVDPEQGDYAAVTVRWDTRRGQTIPEEFTLKLEPAVRLSGVVVDDAGGRVVGAEVSLRSTANGPAMLNGESAVSAMLKDAITDADGRWEIRGVPGDWRDFILRVNHSDHLRSTVIVGAGLPGYAGESVSLDHLLAGNVELELTVGFGLEGLVVDASGRPIEGAAVALGDSRFASGRKTTTSDASGRFTFQGIEEGRQTVTVQAKGYAPDFKAVSVGGDAEPPTFQLETGHVYTGRITDPSGAPISGARVVVAQWNGGQQLDASTTTDTNGYYRLDSLPASGVEFYIGLQGYLQLRNLRPSSALDQNDYVLQPAARISGRVTDAETGEAIGSFRVVPAEVRKSPGGWDDSFSAPNWQEYQTVSGVAGSFTFDMTEAQRYYVLKIEAAGYVPVMSEPVPADDGPREMTFELKRGSGPRGVVVDSDGRPLEGVSVGLAGDGRRLTVTRAGFVDRGSRAEFKRTDEQGRFQFAPVADGLFIAAISPDGFGQVPYSADTTEYRVELKPFGTVRGVLRVPGFETESQHIQLTGEVVEQSGDLAFEFGEFRAATDSEGKFVLHGIPHGSHKLVWLLKISERSWSHALTRDVQVLPGQVTEIVMEQTGRAVTGRLVLSDPTVPVFWQPGSISTIPPQPPGGFGTSEDVEAWEQSPEMRAYREHAVNRTLYFDEDDSFNALPIDPGHYRLNAFGFDPETVDEQGFGGQIVGRMSREVVIPEGTGPFDLGTLETQVLNQLKVGMPASDFSAMDARGEPFSLANFRGRSVMLQFGDLSHLRGRPEGVNTMENELFSIFRRAADQNKVAIVQLTSPDKMESAVEVVLENQLPYVLGAMDMEALQKLRENYASSGTLIIGPDGNIEHMIQASSFAEWAAQLEAALFE